MNDYMAEIEAIAQDTITNETAMMPISMASIDSILMPPYTPPYTMPATASDRTDQSEIRVQNIAESAINKIYFDMAAIKDYTYIAEKECTNRIGLLGRDVDAFGTIIAALQSIVAQQAEAMKILTAEIDELKSGQLEPLEDME